MLTDSFCLCGKFLTSSNVISKIVKISLYTKYQNFVPYNLQIVLHLLKNDAKVNVKDSYGDTPLHLSCYKGCKDTVDCLLMVGKLLVLFHLKTYIDPSFYPNHHQVLQIICYTFKPFLFCFAVVLSFFLFSLSVVKSACYNETVV